MAFDELRWSQRLKMLREQGLHRFEPIVQAFDFVQEEISPKTVLDFRNRSFSQLQNGLARIKSSNLPIQLTARAEGNALKAGLVVPADPLVEHFAETHWDSARFDVIGARSLCGTLRHFGVDVLVVGSRRTNTRALDLRDNAVQRRFRLVDAPEAILRRLIDRAVWGGDRVILPPNLVQLFNAMQGYRQSFLNELGLMLVPVEEGRFYEMFMPDALMQQHLHIAPETLNDLAMAIERRIKLSTDQQFVMKRDSPEEKVRSVFYLICRCDLLHEPAFLERLAGLNIHAEIPDGPVNQWNEIAFRLAGQLSSPQTRFDTELLELTLPNIPSRRPSPSASHQEPDGKPVLPSFLRILVNHLRITGGPEVVPNEKRYCEALIKPEVIQALRQQGIAVESARLGRNGLFDKPVKLYRL